MSEVKKNTVYLNRLDNTLPTELEEAGITKIRSCLQCGSCTASCPSGRRTALRTRLVIRKALLGLKDELLKGEDLWLCTTCYTCYERCPRKIEVTNTIIALRNMAASKGLMLQRHKEASALLLKTGHLVPIDKPSEEKRSSLGLLTAPPTTHSYPDALQEVQTLLRRLEFDTLIGQRGGI